MINVAAGGLENDLIEQPTEYAIHETNEGVYLILKVILAQDC